MSDEASPQGERPKRSIGVILVWVLLLSLLGVLGFGLVKTRQGPLQLGEPMPDFSLRTFEGQQINTVDLRGQVVVVNFWASWCRECELEAAELEQASQMYKDRGVIFIGVDWSDTESKALAYLDEFNITYQNGPDIGQRIVKEYRITGVPETYISDLEGNLAGFKIGPYMSLSELTAAIELALAR